MNIDHRNCDHEATSKDRAACRKARAVRDSRAFDLIRDFNSTSYQPATNYWVFYAANKFAGYQGDIVLEAAHAILDYFSPSGDEAKDNRRRANGYLVTDHIPTMLSTTLHAAS